MEKKTKGSSKVTEEETSLKGIGILKSLAKIELSEDWKRSFKRIYDYDPPLGRRKVIMIDDNPSSEENQKLIEQIKGNSNFDLKIFTNIKDAYDYMKKDLIGEKEAKEEFDFTLIYYILNEKFAERFLDLYETEMEGFNLAPTNIIYCKDPEILKEKEATFDKLFNPGGIATQPEEIFKYLCMSQNSSLGEFFNKTNKGKVPQEDKGESYSINTKADLNSFILPSILGKIIQQNMIHKGSFDGFKEVIKSVCLQGVSPIIVNKDQITQLVEAYKLLNPSLNKRVDLPLYLYSKYFLKLIYSDVEIIKKLGCLSSEELSKCKSVIALFYYALSQRYVKSYDGKLFGFGNFTEDKIKALQNKINKKDSSEDTATLTFKSFQFYYSREDYLDDIMKAFEGDQKKGEFKVKFIIDEKEEGSDIFLSNIDIFNSLEEGKNFKDTSALFLPFSVFEVDSIKKSTKGNYKYIIYLRYLDSYDKKINKALKEKDPEGILKEITKGNSEIAEFFGEDLNDSFYDYLKKKIILFVDTYSKHKYNKDIKEYGDDLNDYNILYSNTVKDALNTIKRFENKLIYTVINSKYFPSFINEYKKKQNDINNILDNIIITDNEEELRKAKGFEETNDKFYNPAGIAKDLKEAVEYILKEEPLKEGNKIKKEKKELKDTFREIADPENDIIKTENPNTKSRIFDKRLEEFQRFISENYKDLMDLAKPSLDKEIKIPPSILSKYFLKMLNSDEFKEDINNYLSNGNIGHYKAFLDSLNEGLKEGTLLSTDDKNQKYFRGGLISKEELDSMEKGDLKECYLTNFQNYTTDNDLCQEDLENLIKENKNQKLSPVKFIINEIKDKDIFINNIDNSGIAEDEIMFLPFSAFKIEKVKKMKEYSEVYLTYLGVYNNTYKTEDTLNYDLLKKDTSYDNFEELQSTKETVCEVKLKNKKSNGTFVNIPIGECPLKFLLTDGDLINEDAVKDNSEIELNLNEGKKIKIKLDDLKREIYQMNFKKDNLTAIEILKEDNLEDDLFLDTDELNTEDILSNDLGKEPSFGKVSSSAKKDSLFSHDLKDISPFSPILDFNSLKAVGIQSKEDSKGILLSEIIQKINDASEKNAKIPSGNCILADYEISPESSYKNKELAKLRKNILGNVSSYETFNELNGSNCKLYVDGERKEFTKEISSNGKHKVKFVIDPSFILEDASYMYYGCISLTHIDFSHFDTSNLKNIKNIFGLCEKLKELDLTNFITEKVEDMSGMLSGCKKLSTLKLSEKFNTEKVKDFSFMFNDCSSLKDIPLDNFNTKEAENMKAMFNNCNELKSLKFPEEFKTDKVKDFSLMFKDCSSLEDLDLSPLDAKNAKDVTEMFNGCKSLSELKVPQNFTPDKIKNEKIFNDCDELNQDEVLKILNMECLFEDVKKKEDFEGIIKKNKKVVIFPYEFPNYELLKLLNLFADEYKDIKFLSLPFEEETKDLFKKYKLSKGKKIYLYENGTEKRKDDFDENDEDYYEVSHDLNLFSENKSENFRSQTHPHPLIKMLFAYFKCDVCKRESSKDGLSVVYRCPKCRHDICLNCINQEKKKLIISKLLLLNKKKK